MALQWYASRRGAESEKLVAAERAIRFGAAARDLPAPAKGGILGAKAGRPASIQTKRRLPTRPH
jgi:hypothetical protein